MATSTYTGGCLCGAIRYEVNDRALLIGTCHCHMCQQWTGSPMLGAVTFASGSVVFTQGTPKIYRSSSVSERGFCEACGSSLFTRYFSGGAFDNVTHVMMGTLDKPDVGPPQWHYGAESELSWMHRNDGIPRISIDVPVDEQNELLADLMSYSEK